MMDYPFLYIRLIQRCVKRDRPHGYIERHHIIPRCLGGGNEKSNIVLLTAREHFIAHQILAKIHPDNNGLNIAAGLMRKTHGGAKAHAWIVERHSIAARKQRIGKKNSDKTRKKLSLAGMGRIRSKEHVDASSAGLRGRKLSDQHKANLSEAKKGKKRKPFSPETLLAMSLAKKGKTQTPEHRLATSLAAKGRIISEDQRRKISLTTTGRKQTAEHNRNRTTAQAAARRKRSNQAELEFAFS